MKALTYFFTFIIFFTMLSSCTPEDKTISSPEKTFATEDSGTPQPGKGGG